MNCPFCGQALQDGVQFCSHCGRSLGNAGAHPSPQAAPAKRSGCKIIATILIAVAFLGLLTTGGVIYFIFHQIAHSEAAELTRHFIQTNSQAHEALGEIQKIGWPLGSISVEGGGSGKADFGTKVWGSKAKGKIYTTLTKVNGVWRIDSARLQMDDGASIDLQSAPVIIDGMPPPSAPLPSAAPTNGGRQLRADKSAASGWRTVEWPKQNVTLEVPADWVEETVNKDEVNFHNATRTAYLSAHATFFDQKISVDPVKDGDLQKSANQLKREEIAGYTLKNLGKGSGLLTIQSRGDGATMAAWTGYVDTEEFGTKSITILVGAPSIADFNANEGILAGILESFQIR